MIRAGLSHSLLTTLVLMYSDELKLFFHGVINYINETLIKRFFDVSETSITGQLIFILAVAVVFFSWGALFHHCAYSRRKHV